MPALSLAGKALKLERRPNHPGEDKRSSRVVIHNICPTDYADVILEEGEELALKRLRFGLIPCWAKGGKTEVWRKFMMTFNARCESVFDLASYRSPVRRQRCLIPVRGWHEWPVRETPFYIHRSDDKPLLLAGIWDCWESKDPADEETGAVVTSMSVITTPPGAYMAKFHDRSPLVLEGERALAWINSDQSQDALRAMMEPYDSPNLQAYRVSTAVNRATNKEPSVCDPVSLPVPHGDAPITEAEAMLPLKMF